MSVLRSGRACAVQGTLLDTQSGQSEGSEAVCWAELAVKGDPSFAQARLLLGKLYRTLGKNSEARENLEAAVKIEPNLAEAHYLLGRIYAEQGDSARRSREVHQVSPDKENIQRLLVDHPSVAKVTSRPRVGPLRQFPLTVVAGCSSILPRSTVTEALGSVYKPSARPDTVEVTTGPSGSA
jgi:tetratricopeptide (TPR) repeat protein